jgi:hypothetical protein
MSWQLPRDLVVKMIEPLFSAKLRYGLELAVNIRKEETDTGLRSLHRVHRAAMKAAFSIPTREHPETSIYYVQQTKQTSVHDMAMQAKAGLVWSLCQELEGAPTDRQPD